VGPVAGPRPLHGGRASHARAHLDECCHIVAPPRPIEINCQKPAGLVKQERVDAENVLPLKMRADRLVINRHEGLVGTFAALDPRLLADAPDPFVGAGGGVALGLLLRIGPQPGKDIFATAEELTEEPDPVRG